MPTAERVALEAIARPVIGLYVARSIEIVPLRRAAEPGLRKSAQSMTRLVAEVLERGCMVNLAPTDGGVRLSPVEQWLVDVEWVLQQLDAQLGPAARHVLVFRLSRTPKKEESSFGRIAIDINAGFARANQAITITTELAEGLYREALAKFVKLMDERSVGCSAVAASASQQQPVRVDASTSSALIRTGQSLQRFAQRCAMRPRRRIAGGERLHRVNHGARI